jgi:DNA-binding PadR family transcriptional regulator
MSAPRRSVLATAVLSMLTEEPMHAYRMQQLIRERHKDDVVNVAQRNSIYQTIERLVRDGLVEVGATERAENRPERTTYHITDAGRFVLNDWLRTMLGEPVNEYPEFPAALSFLPNLTRAEAVASLTARAERLEQRLAALDEELTQTTTFLARVFRVESEYQREMVAAELDYVRTLLADIRASRVAW